jgi:hypothetical protein
MDQDTDRWTDRWADVDRCGLLDYRQMDIHMDRRTHRRTDTQIGKQTFGWTANLEVVKQRQQTERQAPETSELGPKL